MSTNEIRELSKAHAVLERCAEYFDFQAKMNATAHMAVTVLHPPLMSEICAVLTSIELVLKADEALKPVEPQRVDSAELTPADPIESKKPLFNEDDDNRPVMVTRKLKCDKCSRVDTFTMQFADGRPNADQVDRRVAAWGRSQNWVITDEDDLCPTCAALA